MGKSKFSPDKFIPNGEETRSNDPNLHDRCSITGCNRDGHIHVGYWLCRYHYSCHGEGYNQQVNFITVLLNNHKPEFDHYERLLAARSVDWECGDLRGRCPTTLAPLEGGEKFEEHKARVTDYINKLLKYQPSIRPRKQQITNKDRAAGEATHISNHFPAESSFIPMSDFGGYP
jgi:hypothetical protein